MIAPVVTWWRARTPRERVLLQVAAALLFAVALPLAANQQASAYRARAIADRVAAQELVRQVEALATTVDVTNLTSPIQGTPQEVAQTIAQSLGLAILVVEPVNDNKIRIRFAPANPLALMRWIEQITRNGITISASSMTRQGDTELVEGQFDVTLGPNG
jgi:type II secretory pathway component PulM